MSLDNQSPLPILVAIPDDWREAVTLAFEQQHLVFRVATTYVEAVSCIKSESLRGIVTVSEWAVPDESDSNRGVLAECKAETPVVVLVRSGKGFWDYFKKYDTLFLNNPNSPKDDYIHTPFGIKHLFLSMQGLGIVNKEELNF